MSSGSAWYSASAESIRACSVDSVAGSRIIGWSGSPSSETASGVPARFICMGAWADSDCAGARLPREPASEDRAPGSQPVATIASARPAVNRIREDGNGSMGQR